jgi:hypothetical protein
MIVTKLHGGLGNQLFQWAATYAAAKKYECEYYFDLRYFSNKKIKKSSVDKWDYELDKFNIEIKEFSEPSPLPVRYDNFCYQSIEPNYYLYGYWQSEKYFVDYKDEILSILKNYEKEKYFLDKYKVLSENTLSLHVRRGDYVRVAPNNVLSLDYYYNALEDINYKNFYILVFSDDLEWCRENFKNFKKISFINENNFDSLIMMSLCKNNIIANSTFSWWGAYLNNYSEKKVIAPQKWFDSKQYQNIIPDEWITL